MSEAANESISETDKMNQANLKKVDAEIAKLLAETSKINRENVYYPLVVGSGITLAIVAVVKIFL